MEEFYKKKIIRDFLTLFSESKWKNLCILCMEYGILMLKQKYQISSLSMEDIEEFVNDLIEEENKKNQKNLKKLRKDIASNTNFNYNSSSNANNTSTSFKPSSDWRKGEVKTIFDGDDTNNFINNQKYNNYNQNTNNYHYNQNNRNNNFNKNYEIQNNNNYIDTTNTFSNDEPAFIKKGKDKLIDDILYPKQNKIVNYHKDNIFNSNLPKKQQMKQYKTSYNESYGIKKKNDFNNINSRYKNNTNNNKNYDYYNNTSFTDNISFNNSKSLKRSSSFSNNNRFKSGLQKLKMTKPLNNKMNNDDSMNNSFSVRANYSNKINNVPSKIKSQVDADKKIYGLLKKNQGNKYY